MNWRDRADRLRPLPLLRVLAALEATADPGDPAKWHCARGVLSVTAPTQPAAVSAPQMLTLPPAAAHHWPRVERYLVEERKLPRSLLLPLRESGILYADAHANAVFLLGDTAATAVGADLRGTTARSWRGLAPGSRKDRGFFSVSAAPATQAIVLCESAIDALSCHALHPDYRCLSTSGARPDAAWLRTLIAHGLSIYCGFDADPTGEAMAQRMIHLHPSSELKPPSLERKSLSPSPKWVTSHEHTRVISPERRRAIAMRAAKRRRKSRRVKC